MFRLVLTFPYLLISDGGYMVRLDLAIQLPIDSDYGYMLDKCYPFRSLLIATMATCFG